MNNKIPSTLECYEFKMETELIEKLAKFGNSIAQHIVMKRREKNIVLTQWDKEKIDLYTQLKNNPEASNSLGLEYLYGNQYPRDNDRALELFKYSAIEQYADAQCNFAILSYLQFGKIFEWNTNCMSINMQLGTASKNNCVRADGLFNLLFTKAESWPYQFDTAITGFTKAAEAGDQLSMEALIFIYTDEFENRKDPTKAEELKKKLEATGNPFKR